MKREKNLSTVYNPEEVEEKWYQIWERNGYFRANVSEELSRKKAKGQRQTFSMVMPPPNVTGSLHLGHALDNTLQDILARWHRMSGAETLWLPGTDHAGIATQAKVEEQLTREGLTKEGLGREQFLARVWAWKKQYGGQITTQLRKLGSSCDWSKERFTLDEGCSQAVREVFVRLYEKGLIYQGNYIINWCPQCETTISDIEVEHTPQKGKIWYIRYPFVDGEGFLLIATTRPETMFGDLAVAVHPEDKRYQQFIGRKLRLPLTDRVLPVLADTFVEQEFGTGVVKITPSHDPNDFLMGQRHNLAQLSILDHQGVLNEQAGKYAGLERFAAREKVVADLAKEGFLEKVEEHENAIGRCYRCDTVIEPMVSKQWFVKMKPLAEPAIQAVREGEIRFIPERFTKIYLNWLENIRDWCISRQLWWGHRLPVWYCSHCAQVICAREEPSICPQCGAADLVQDPDVLDTWFSSALWPFSTLGWPQETDAWRIYYPTSVLVTGRDIIFFWVARMIFAALEFMPDVPFHDVFIHGLVLDGSGRKMSKSLGNGIDPLELIEKYGADTLRFMLITGNTPGNDLRFQIERLEAVRNFANKIWNASRFVLLNLGDQVEPGEENDCAQKYTLADRWIRSRFNRTAREVSRNLTLYELGEAARLIYEFTWDDFCDWYIEMVKPRLYGRETKESRSLAQKVLVQTLRETMELLHPFMPFLTEEIWQHLPHQGESVMLAPWPGGGDGELDEEAETEMALLQDVIRAIRNLRSEMNVPLGKKVNVVLMAREKSILTVLQKEEKHLVNLAKLAEVTLTLSVPEKPARAVTAVISGVEVYLLFQDLLDWEREKGRLGREDESLQQEITRLEKKLNNQGFLEKAPAAIIEKEKGKLADYRRQKEVLQEKISSLGGLGDGL